ncbi:hypothetical protein SERLA73DRAFT_75788 [Serpula lacrymans var. lacrymans S7.3]|uniref:Uncharacterized protein n=1 Tax=Serpula lacrymans var. lacrymans (strain S7.3) TaxID=936435 RepID=F8Q486_SERL3|nr:hypothetical protein SERLA73DRAFT_75788 [Serpula lacrymans var. lacrymans S7.3]
MFRSIESTVRNACHNQRESPCHRCGILIRYDQKATWETVNRLVNEHWQICPNGIGTSLDRQRWTHCLPYQAANTNITPKSENKSVGGVLLAGQAGTYHPGNSHETGGGDRMRREQIRRERLLRDEYTDEVTATSVRCKGCNRVIRLDNRVKYYPGLWTKHRGKCPAVKRLERKKKHVQPTNPPSQDYAAEEAMQVQESTSSTEISQRGGSDRPIASAKEKSGKILYIQSRSQRITYISTEDGTGAMARRQDEWTYSSDSSDDEQATDGGDSKPFYSESLY